MNDPPMRGAHVTPTDETPGAGAPGGTPHAPVTRRSALQAAGVAGAAGLAAAAGLPLATSPGAGAQPAGRAAGTAPAGADPSRRFAGRVVLVTGATSGIGRTTAEHFAREGARVVFCGRREALGREVEQGIRRAGGEATYVRADVRREEDVERLVAACVARYGGLHVAFNNAGITNPRSAAIAEQPSADYADVMQTNAFGTFYCLKHELALLARNAPWGAYGTRGVVINNASVSGHTGFARISPYSASKHAVIGLTRCAAIEYGPQGVRVTSIAPGGVDTPMRRRAYEAQGYAGPQPAPMPNLLRRVNTTDEMADVVLFLASDAGSSLVGADLDVTSGMLTGAHFTQARG